MRQATIISMLSLFSLISYSQMNVDSLIQRIDNGQIRVVMQYVWYPQMQSSAGDSLVIIGRPATKKLFELLVDSTRGIIAHFILSHIYKHSLSSVGRSLNSSAYQVTIGKNRLLGLFYAGLEFHQDESSQIVGHKEQLQENQNVWSKLLEIVKNR